jgi:hypothetical protein
MDANANPPNPLDINEVTRVLTVCQATPLERTALIERERLNTLADYAEFTQRDIAELATRLERRTGAARIVFPAKLVKNLQALCFWAHEKTRMAEELDPEEFTPEVLATTKEMMRMRNETKADAPSIKPDKFDPDKWTTWSKQFVNYLSNVTGHHHTPIDYVIRDEPPLEPIDEMSERDKALYAFPLNGRHYQYDNMQVYRLLSDLVCGTSGFTWIADYDRTQNGRAAWTALVEHYEGGVQKEKRTTTALAMLRNLHYKNESAFSFEDFSRKMVQGFRDLEGTEEEITDYNKVRMLLEKIQLNLPRAEVAKAHVRQNFRQDLLGAIDFLGTEFADMFADAIVFKRARSREISGVERPSQRSKTTDDEPVTNPNGTTTFHGVDVTDVSRVFTGPEMSELGPKGQRYIFRERDRLGVSRSSRGGRGGRGRGGRSNDGGRRVAAMEVSHGDEMNESPKESENSTTAQENHAKPDTPAGNKGTRNGSTFGSGAYNS